MVCPVAWKREPFVQVPLSLLKTLATDSDVKTVRASLKLLVDLGDANGRPTLLNKSYLMNRLGVTTRRFRKVMSWITPHLVIDRFNSRNCKDPRGRTILGCLRGGEKPQLDPKSVPKTDPKRRVASSSSVNRLRGYWPSPGPQKSQTNGPETDPNERLYNVVSISPPSTPVPHPSLPVAPQAQKRSSLMSYEFDPIDETLLGELEEVVAELTQYTDEPIPKLWSRERGMKDIRLFRERGPYPVDGNPIEVGTEGVRETIQQLRMHPDERERLFFARAIGIKRFFFVPQTIATREDGTKLPRRSPGEMLRYIAPMLKDAADFIKDGYDPVSGQKLMKVKHTERTPEGAVFMARRGEGMAYLDAQLQIVL